MGRHFENELKVNGRAVGYGLFHKDGYYRIRFHGPDGKKLERATGATTKGEARAAAGELIGAVYDPAPLSRVTWDEVIAHLENTPDLRAGTLASYKQALKTFREFNPKIPGPAAVSPQLANRFLRDLQTTPFKRGDSPDAPEYRRSPTTCATVLRSLRSVWSKHFKPFGFVTDNPWKEVQTPNAPRGRRVNVPDEGKVAEFFVWLSERHPGWELPRLYLEVKIFAGTRTMDLSQAKTADLRDGCLHMSAEATKTREARTIPLPPALYTKLQEVAGPTWVWERSVEDCKKYRANAQARSRTEYSPSTWRYTIQNLHKEFNEGRAKPGRITPHDWRARTFTALCKATGSAEAAAHIMRADVQTARHYAEYARVVDAGQVLREVGQTLLPGDTARK